MPARAILFVFSECDTIMGFVKSAPISSSIRCLCREIGSDASEPAFVTISSDSPCNVRGVSCPSTISFVPILIRILIASSIPALERFELFAKESNISNNGVDDCKGNRRDFAIIRLDKAFDPKTSRVSSSISSGDSARAEITAP